MLLSLVGVGILEPASFVDVNWPQFPHDTVPIVSASLHWITRRFHNDCDCLSAVISPVGSCSWILEQVEPKLHNSTVTVKSSESALIKHRSNQGRRQEFFQGRALGGLQGRAPQPFFNFQGGGLNPDFWSLQWSK